MTAIGMLVRAAWRRHWRASLYLAVMAGLAAGIVGASFQAAARADTSLERFRRQSRNYDLLVQGCPPGVDPRKLASISDLVTKCVNPEVAERFRGVLNRVDGVERTAVESTLVVGLLDPSASNHWGHLTYVTAINTPDSSLLPARPIVVEGRLFDPAASDEIVISEDTAQAAGFHAGDVVHLAGWHQADLNAAGDGPLAPQTSSFASKIVGVVRFLDDVQADGTGSLSDFNLPGNPNFYAGPGWTAAHGADLSTTGSSVLVRLRGGTLAVEAFESQMNKAPEGWFNQVSPASAVDPESVRRVIDLERRALLVFAFVATVAGAVFVGLTSVRQFRQESAEGLFALGMTRRDLRAVNIVRALSIAVPACLVAGVSIVALSLLGPLGLARKLEFDLPVRFDAVVLATTVLALLTLFSFAGLMTRVETEAPRLSASGARPSRLDLALKGPGAVFAVGASVARSRLSRAPIAVTAIAIAAGVAAGCVVASYDRLVADSPRYGAQWDVAVGQYFDRGAVDEGIAKLRANPAVLTAAGYFEQPDVAQSDVSKIEGRNARFLALADYIGHSNPVMALGRTPMTDNEVALGRATAREIHRGIGDTVKVVSATDETLPLHVVGIVVVNDPIAARSGAGDGVFVRPRVFAEIAGPGGDVAQSIVLRLDPQRDHAAAIESVRRDFPGSIREAVPPVDVGNLGRLRALPWLIAGLLAILALATLIHASAIMFARNRMTLGVLAALGFTRGQRRGVCVFASMALVFVGVVIGIPTGIIVGQRVWRALSDGIDLPSTAAMAWLTLTVASIGAFGLAALVALVGSRKSVRMTPSEQLRVE
ncbi:MAG: ABC transporter permease [Acidimicrobiales bacterium]